MGKVGVGHARGRCLETNHVVDEAANRQPTAAIFSSSAKVAIKKIGRKMTLPPLRSAVAVKAIAPSKTRMVVIHRATLLALRATQYQSVRPTIGERALSAKSNIGFGGIPFAAKLAAEAFQAPRLLAKSMTNAVKIRRSNQSIDAGRISLQNQLDSTEIYD
jgi:PPE-repeat protein